MKQIKKAVLLCLLGITAASCQKGNVLDMPVNVTYTIDGETHYASSGNNLFMWLATMAREGYEITVFPNGYTLGNPTKEKVIFTTTSDKEAAAWAQQMHDEGYTVTITYDKTTGVYTCTAVK